MEEGVIMNVLFLTMSSGLKNIETSGIYTDLIRKFRDEGHEVYVVYPRERRLRLPTEVKHEGRVHLLGVKTLNVTKTNLIEKGLGQVTLERQFKLGLEKYFGKVKFDIILYSTPPITFTKVIRYAKKRNPKAVSYLLLKDIFPQNAVDLGILTKDGLKGVLYRLFRKKEKDLYRISDYIGCMSPANVKYVIEHNPEIDPAVVEIAPNSYDIPSEISVEYGVTDHIRQKYGLPINKPIFIYGGNMGKPQGIPFLIKCLEAVKDRIDSYFVIVGDGTEYSKLEAFMRERIPKDDYDQLVKVCDVGLIFLDYRFTIPNYPNRLLPYLMERKPIIAATDPNCDIGVLAEENGYGVYCPSDSVETFVKAIDKMLVSDMRQMGENGYRFFLNNYTTEHTYKAIMKHIVK